MIMTAKGEEEQRTVDTHVLNLRKKIEATPDRAQHLLTAQRVGYRLVL
jgi:DNA-binding response OmpR family regulator